MTERRNPSAERTADQGTASGLAETMANFVAVCASFGLTVPEAKTETKCLTTKGMDRVTFDIEAAGQVVYKTNLSVRAPWVDYCCMQGRRPHRRDQPARTIGQRTHRTVWPATAVLPAHPTVPA